MATETLQHRQERERKAAEAKLKLERERAQQKANRDRDRAQQKFEQERRRAQDEVNRQRQRAQDKARQDALVAKSKEGTTVDGARQQAIDGARKHQRKVAELAHHEQVEAQKLAHHLAVEAGEKKRDAWRAHERGLVFCNVNLTSDVLSKLEQFQEAVEIANTVVDPNTIPLPLFLETPERQGVWKSPALFKYSALLEMWIPDDFDGTHEIPGTFTMALPDWFDIWLSWATPNLTNILWHARDLLENFVEIAGSAIGNRDEWQPGRVNWEELREAIATVHPEASVEWNETVEAVPTPPGAGTLSHVSYGTFLGEPYELRKPFGDGYASGEEDWANWLEQIDLIYGTMEAKRSALIASRPALERVVSAFRPFGKGKHYPWRGR